MTTLNPNNNNQGGEDAPPPNSSSGSRARKPWWIQGLEDEAAATQAVSDALKSSDSHAGGVVGEISRSVATAGTDKQKKVDEVEESSKRHKTGNGFVGESSKSAEAEETNNQKKVEFPNESEESSKGHPTEYGDEMAASSKFLADPIEDRTYARRIASWLNENGFVGPESSPSPNVPSLDKAWVFFEHVTLPRYLVDSNSRGGGQETENVFKGGERQLNMAEPGEADLPTKLYPVFSTPLSQLGDFGLGFGIYFSTIRAYAALAFLCGLLSLPNIIYFASEEYSPDQFGVQTGVPTLLKGSAICTNRRWVPCPTCTQEQFDKSMRGTYDVKRFAKAWTVTPTDAGFYLNVTDYLSWDLNATTGKLDRTDQGVVNMNRLLSVSLPQKFSSAIELSPSGGYILFGQNVTKENNGTTPLWCGYSAESDCYLDLYPFYREKHDKGVTYENSQNLMAPVEIVGDTEFLQIGFALRSDCIGATRQQGMLNWGTLLLMIVGSFFIRTRNNSREVKFDEDEQTAQDYSIVIKNPPDDAWDPEEWKEFLEGALRTEAGGKFEKGQEVRICTVDVDNERAIHHLVERRDVLRRLEIALPLDTPLDTKSLEHQAEIAKAQPSACFPSKIPSLVASLLEIEKEIKSVFADTKVDPPTTRVYATFETEAAQRTILSNMSVTRKQAREDDTTAVSPHYLFRGKHVLYVGEPDEPDTIRWQDLNASHTLMNILKACTSLATLAAMALSYFIIQEIYHGGLPWLAGIVTTVFTYLFPTLAVFLMNLEKHESETSRQAWLFAKVAFFNVFVTTILMSLFTPFQATLDKKEASLPGLLPGVYTLFFSQLCISPGLQILDIYGNLQRHILAPMARTQDEMNQLMRGTEVTLAERYGNLIKFIFMTLWYCSIYPGVFFMGSFAFIITYFADRFNLMRSWARSPHVGPEISYFARNYFTPIGICLMSVMSAYYWSGFPYDNLCEVENPTLPSYYYGDFNIDLEAKHTELDALGLSFNLYNVDAVTANFTIVQGVEVYKFCNQNLVSFSGLSFPALPQWQKDGEEWMEREQEEIVTVHGWTSLVVLVLCVLAILSAILSSMDKTFKPRGEDQHIDFSDVPSMDSYIPQVPMELSPYPLVLCCIDDIDVHLFAWQDAYRLHSHYDVTRDIAAILGTTDYPNIFARLKYWPRDREAEEQAAGNQPEEEGLVPYPPRITN